MPHPFEIRKEIEIDASPEAIWEAITTGRGIDGWFLGIGNEVDGRPGGRVRIAFGEGAFGEHTITTWEPNRLFAHSGDPDPDGLLHAFEYEIEAREGGRTVLRFVHTGFMADDWEAEYDALTEGDFMYLHQLAQYVTHFRGQQATLIVAIRSDEPDLDRVLTVLRPNLGLPADVAEGQRASANLDGLGTVQGVVDFVSRTIIGFRADDGLYRFLQAGDVVYLGHHLYGPSIDEAATRAAWQGWLDRAFA